MAQPDEPTGGILKGLGTIVKLIVKYTNNVYTSSICHEPKRGESCPRKLYSR